MFFQKGPNPASFCLFSFFSNKNFTEKTVGFSGIRTWIVGVERKHADHLTTNTAHLFIMLTLVHVFVLGILHFRTHLHSLNASSWLSVKLQQWWWWKSMLSTFSIWQFDCLANSKNKVLKTAPARASALKITIKYEGQVGRCCGYKFWSCKSWVWTVLPMTTVMPLVMTTLVIMDYD